MARPSHRSTEPFPCYAMTMPGLEAILADELAADFDAEVRRSLPGLVVFRPGALERGLLDVKTAEDVFILLWGTDKLTYRAGDLEKITRWTANEPDWPRALQLHHAIRPKPKGKPSYHLVAQMQGEHGYRRVDALKAMAKGMAGKFPASWKPAEEDAAVEVWLTIRGAMAVCGLRLSDRTMRHRTYKESHLPASLRPVVAAAMVRLARPAPREWLVDPACGAGTILAERLAIQRDARVLGGDLDHAALRTAYGNLRRFGPTPLVRWDARALPLATGSIDCLACNPPFGKQLGRPEEIGPLYRAMIDEVNRVVRPGGRAVLLVAELRALEEAIRSHGWKRGARHRLRILGQPAFLTSWIKP